MDHHHHHHHQQQQWRPMPIPGNICPTCSNSHFPFCPPFNQIQNPRPPFDPHLLPTGPPRPPWRRNPSLDREPYTQFQLQQSYCNGFANEYDRNSKRPRVDDMQPNNQNSVGVSSDIERRLKLIRDHGSSLGGPMPGMNNHETNRYVQESLGFDGNYGKFDGSWESRSELGPMGVRNLEMNNFHDLRFGPGDRVGQPYMQSNRNGFHNEEEFMHSSRYGINTVDQAPPPPPPPHIAQRVPPYPGSEVPNDHYHNTHNPQWRQGSDSVPESEWKYSHMNNWHGPSVMYPEQRGSVAMDNRGPKNQQQQQFYGMQNPVDTRQPLDVGFQSKDGNRGPIRHHSMPGVTQHGPSNLNERGGYFQSPSGGSMVFENTGQTEASRFYSGQPPIPASPPPPLPFDQACRPSSELKAYSSPPKTTASLFPVAVSSSAMVPTSYQPIPKAHSLSPPPYYHNKPLTHASTGFFSEAVGDGQPFSLKQLSSDKPKVIDASHLFKRPHRATRPDHIVIILRGLPGSGKSYLAKMLRDLEVENGGHAPRIHSMDDYFMTEVEKIEEGDASKSSVRGKKPIMKMVMEYCYEPEMEEAYRSSMLKAFKKTLEEGGFTFIIVDDRNLRVADFAQFWAIGKSSGYEVYILEATYKDPAGCAARNVHGFTQDDVEKMARQWEEAPSLYLQLDVKTLFHGDDLKESGIQEVEMDMEDEDVDGNLSGLQERMPENNIVPPLGEDTPDDSSKDGNRWDSEGDHLTEEVKELGRSKWSDDLDEEDTERTERVKGNVNALSGLIQAYGKGAKSVRWADKVGNTGFSLHATKKADVSSLVIGPGTGYNLKSNPLREETPAPSSGAGESKRQSIFQERLRAERESFKLVFDRRRQRIGLGLDAKQIPQNATIDLSFNSLSGPIPESLALLNQKKELFAGNADLCGKPLTNLCSIPSTMSTPPNDTTESSPAIAAIPKTIDSTPVTSSDGTQDQAQGGLKPGTIAAIAVGDLAGLSLLVMVIVYLYHLRKRKNTLNQTNAANTSEKKPEVSVKQDPAVAKKPMAWSCLGEEISEATSSDGDQDDNKMEVAVEMNPNEDQLDQKGKLVTVDGETELELETLLKASAYVLGASGPSIVYRAVLDDGTALAVRRIGESGVERMRDFENQVRVIAKLRHPNLVRVRGFYWGEDEKLVIYDFVSNGSLASTTHKKAGSLPSHLPLEVRVKIAKGVARGLAYIHDKKHVHGSIKPSNILLNSDMEPIISDFGLDRLVLGNTSQKTNTSARFLGIQRSTTTREELSNPGPNSYAQVGSSMGNASSPYQAPESLKNIKTNPKYDVYSYGIVLLELLTGKVFSDRELSQWSGGSAAEEKNRVLRLVDVSIKAEVEGKEDALLACFKVGLSCASFVPQKRPSMKEVLQALEKISNSLCQ